MRQELLQRIYERVRTPYKYGAVLKLSDRLTDSPVVFRHDSRYYMSYVSIDRNCTGGYTTHLAVSNDLFHWESLFPVLTAPSAWDASQCGGYAQFVDNAFGGTNAITSVNGRYYFAYIGGNLSGYETDPLSMGLAYTPDLLVPDAYRKFPRPILTGQDADARQGETLTVYKADMFRDEAQMLGHPYVCAYNAKDSTHRESIFLAVSDDGEHWERYGDRAVIAVTDCPDTVHINGDPQIVRMDGTYVMFYFVMDGSVAYNTFAVSDDLIHWTKWTGEPLMTAQYPWENVFAHKQWILEEDGTVYHFYCAVNEQNERFIALATSREIKK